MPKSKDDDVVDVNRDDDENEDDDDEEEYQVEKIIDSRMVRGRKEYLLKWKGYPDSENTWEPHSNLDCDDLIKTFEDNRKKKREEKEKAKEKESSREKEKEKEREKEKDMGKKRKSEPPVERPSKKPKKAVRLSSGKQYEIVVDKCLGHMYELL